MGEGREVRVSDADRVGGHGIDWKPGYHDGKAPLVNRVRRCENVWKANLFNLTVYLPTRGQVHRTLGNTSRINTSYEVDRSKEAKYPCQVNIDRYAISFCSGTGLANFPFSIAE